MTHVQSSVSTMRASLLGGIALLATSVAVVSAAHADTIGEQFLAVFTDCNAGLSCGTGNVSPSLGTATLTYEGTFVNVDVHLNNGEQFVQTDHKATFSFTLASGLPTPTLSNVSTGWTPTSGSPLTGFNVDGMGQQQYGLDWSGGTSSPDPNDLVFHISDTGGLTLEDFVLGGPSGDNTTAYYFVADILCGASQRNCTNTGQIGAPIYGQIHNQEGVPGPLAGAGLPGLGALAFVLLGWYRRARKNMSALVA
jgi:hypothetical protein